MYKIKYDIKDEDGKIIEGVEETFQSQRLALVFYEYLMVSDWAVKTEVIYPQMQEAV